MFTTRCLLPAFRGLTPRLYSTVPPTGPPLLATIKGDLKTAMRAKDTARLSVLRAILSATLNASKTATPIKTDVQLVNLLRKTAAAGEDAARQFREAGRGDLVEKEMVQVGILKGYIEGSGVVGVSGEELEGLVRGVLMEVKKTEKEKGGKSLVGEAMKRLNGELEGKDVDKKEVAALVKKFAEEMA